MLGRSGELSRAICCFLRSRYLPSDHLLLCQSSGRMLSDEENQGALTHTPGHNLDKVLME